MATTADQILATLQSRYGTQDFGNYNIRRQSFYDYGRYNNSGVTSQRFFTNPVGSTDPVSSLSKTLEETNLQTANQLNYNFILTQIRTHIYLLPKKRQPTSIATLTRALANDLGATNLLLAELALQGVLTVSFGQKLYFDIEQPFKVAPAGFGVEVTAIPAAAATTAIPLNYLYQTSNRTDDIYNTTPPVLIEKSQTIDVQIQFPNGTSTAIATVNGAAPAINLGVIFDGYIIEPVQ